MSKLSRRPEVKVPWINPRKPLPRWIRVRDMSTATKYQKRAVEYYIQLWLCTPPWVERRDLVPIYTRAHELRLRGHDVEVDHITPINAVDSCGLHCPANLQIIDRLENQNKSNLWYPGMPNEQQRLFDLPEQFELFPI